MTKTLLLAATLVLPTLALAAPSDSAPAPAAPMAAHAEDDDHVADSAPMQKGETLADYFWRKSDAAFHAGDYPRAVSLHRAIVAVDPTDVESYSVGAWLLWSLDKKTEANDFIALGLKNNPQSSEMWDAAGQQYDLAKDFVSARDAFGKSVALAGKDAAMMLRRRYAHASEHAGDLAASAQIWRDLVRDYPADAVNKSNLARVEAQINAGGQQTSFGGATKATILIGAVGALAILGVPLAGRYGKNAI